MKRRRRYAYTRRDPAENRKRPYERYAATKMSKLALRRLALQSIGRPAVAQGPLHDVLFEMYPEHYAQAIRVADEQADLSGRSHAVMFMTQELTLPNVYSPFWVLPYKRDTDTETDHWSSKPTVITYIAWRKRKRIARNPLIRR